MMPQISVITNLRNSLWYVQHQNITWAGGLILTHHFNQIIISQSYTFETQFTNISCKILLTESMSGQVQLP